MITDDLWLILARTLIITFTLALAWMTYRTHQLLQVYQPTDNVLLSPAESTVRLGMVGFCLWLAWLSGLSRETLGFVAPDPWGSVGLGLLAGVLIQLVINTISLTAIRWFGTSIHSTWLVGNIMPRRPIEWVLVPIAFIPAVAMEEILFRSLLLGGFSDMLSLPILIIATSILFGFMHQTQGVLGVFGATGLNVVLSLLFLWTGELLVPLITHYIINVSQLFVVRYIGLDRLNGLPLSKRENV